MSRVRPADGSGLDPEERAVFDAVTQRARAYGAETAGGWWEYYGALLHSPRLAHANLAVGNHFRANVTDRQRNLAMVVVACELASAFVLDGHLADAVASGVRPEAVLALLDGRDDDLTAEELEQVRFIRAVLAGTVTDAAFAALDRRLGTRALVDLTALVVHVGATCRLIAALGCEGPELAKVRALAADLGRARPGDPIFAERNST